jgi:hypothetical protein
VEPVDFSKCSRVIQMVDFLSKGVVTPISGCEQSKELEGCNFSGGFSIVRIEIEVNDVYRLPRLPPCQ